MSDMAASVHAPEVREGLWNGGVSPFKVGSKKLGMWFFILSDALTFSAIIIAYSYIRVSTPNWPTPFTWSSVITASIMTFLLLSSSITMVMAVDAAQKGLRGRFGMYVPPVLKILGLAEVEDNPRNNRMRAKV